MFALAPGGSALHHRWQEAPGGAWAAAWQPFGTAAGGAPRVVRDGSGRLTVAAPAPSGVAVFHRRQTVPSGGWGEWQHLFGWSDAAPALAPSADGRLEAFALSPGGARLVHRWYADPAGTWAAAREFGEPGAPLAATPTAAADATGRIHVFAVTADGRIRTRVQERPSGGSGPWNAFGERLVAPLPAGTPAC